MPTDLHELKWESSRCAVCGSSQSKPVLTGPDRTHPFPGEFTFVQCLKCGAFRQDPRLAWESLQQFYPEDYNSYYPLVRDIKNPLRRLEHRYGPWKRMRAIEKRCPGGRLLEVGCGTGLLLEEALRSERWQLTGIETNKWAAEKVRQELDIPVIESPLADDTFPEAHFDVIVYWNVLEHLYDPIRDLQISYKILKPGGWLVIGIPNMESWDRLIFGRHWIGWELPRHLYLFPRPTLRAVLQETGFRWDWAGCISSSHAAVGLSLQIWSQAWASRNLARAAVGVYRSVVGKLLALPGLWLSDKLGRSTILAVFAQKTPQG